MAVKIRLKRLGKIRVPQYRIVVVDSRKKRDGKVIEEIGKYHPKEDPSYIDVVTDRAQYWLGVGAQPSEAVEQILKITGDWQKFKGLPGTEGTLKVKEPKRDKLEIFNEALKDAASEPKAGATTARKKAEKKAEEAPAAEETPAAEAPAAEAPAEEAPAAEAPAEEAPAPVPAEETPEGAADAAETAETAEADAEAKSGDEA
ncbi:30S ribosomal protein S16 [Nocardioides islandensis]|uniref:Small ribosomal subunit protein bS16 n=1 Tax=Nocardioides islandensis TaxID=433663 RepID=A0A930YK10_9ACTN|nr:30S ribosomal protein S16 [Nocardioides islandensis]